MNSKVDFAAGGIVFYNNMIVLVKNRRDEGGNDRSFWGYPKGHLEDGEKPSEAALREVYEETGFKVELCSETPIAESRYQIDLENTVVNKTVWFYEMKVIKAFEKEPDDEIEFVHQGIAQRKFRRNWSLADTVVVKGAKLSDGILKIALENQIPEEKKPQTIKINTK